MIQKIKTVTYHLNSHSHASKLSQDGQLLASSATNLATRPSLKKIIWHLQDVLKVMTKLQKEETARKESMLDTSSTAFNRCSRTFNQETKK